MSGSQHSGAAGFAGGDAHAMLFAQLVMQQANMAMMLLGKVAHPQTGQIVKDLEAAQLFIDQLEMLEAKTKGNLSRDETELLKQSLMSLRLAFVEAVGSAPAADNQPEPQPAAPAPSPAAGTPAPEPESEESRKKFSKKY